MRHFYQFNSDFFMQKKCTGMNENKIQIFIYIDKDILRK